MQYARPPCSVVDSYLGQADCLCGCCTAAVWCGGCGFNWITNLSECTHFEPKNPTHVIHRGATVQTVSVSFFSLLSNSCIISFSIVSTYAWLKYHSGTWSETHFHKCSIELLSIFVLSRDCKRKDAVHSEVSNEILESLQVAAWKWFILYYFSSNFLLFPVMFQGCMHANMKIRNCLQSSKFCPSFSNIGMLFHKSNI